MFHGKIPYAEFPAMLTACDYNPMMNVLIVSLLAIPCTSGETFNCAGLNNVCWRVCVLDSAVRGSPTAIKSSDMVCIFGAGEPLFLVAVPLPRFIKRLHSANTWVTVQDLTGGILSNELQPRKSH
jgi:hypothetical protein